MAAAATASLSTVFTAEAAAKSSVSVESRARNSEEASRWASESSTVALPMSSALSRLELVPGDITVQEVDAIVNAANESLLGGGGVDGAIHRAGGPAILAECRTLGGCPTGEARISNAGRLPAEYVIHAVGPVWRGGADGEPELLRSAYRHSLLLAAEHDCDSVAFPAISCGVFGYPYYAAATIALSEALAELERRPELTVRFVLFDFEVGRAFTDILALIDPQGGISDLRRRIDLAVEAVRAGKHAEAAGLVAGWSR